MFRGHECAQASYWKLKRNFKFGNIDRYLHNLVLHKKI